MGLNDDVDEEFGSLENKDRAVVLESPRKSAENNDVSDESVFTKGITPRKLPELDAEFVLQKSKEDRLSELTERSAEIEQAGGISRDDVIAVESIIEDLEGRDGAAPVEAPPAAKDDEDEDPPEPAKQTLGNPKLFTEERSKTEYEPAMGLLKSKYEQAYGELKCSTIDLGKKLLEKADEEISEKRLAYVEINTQLNKNIIKFLDNYGSSDLEDVKCNITRFLKWSDLMAVPFQLLQPHLITYDDYEKRAAQLAQDYQDTKTGEFIGNLQKLFRSDFVYRTLVNFSGNNLLNFNSNGKVYTIDPATGVYKPLSVGNELTSYVASESTYSIGSLFAFMGTNRLMQIIDSRVKAYDYSKQCVRDAIEACNGLDNNAENNTKEKLDLLVGYSSKINESRIVMVSMLSEIGAVFAAYEIVNQFMLDMSH